MRNGYRYGEAEYFDFISQTYQANRFEMEDEGDSRFLQGSHNAMVNGQRFHRMLKCLDRHAGMLPDAIPEAVDIGCYPGTWINLVRHFFPDFHWQGVGLCISNEFLEWVGDNQVPVVETEMDPFYDKVEVGNRLPFGTASIDLVVASEIFEHLISPLEFLRESRRVLRAGGLLLLTTPNVSNIGAIAHLLRGGSNYERLLRSPMFLAGDEWRGHVRFYSKSELQWLGECHDLEMIHHQYYHDDYPLHVLRRSNLSSVFKRLIRRTFGIVPWFRGGHIIMFRRRP